MSHDLSMPDDADATLALLRDSAQDFLAREHRRERLQVLYEGRAAVDRGFWRRLADQGWLALRLPEAQGGSGLELVHAAALAEAFGRHVVPEPLVACAMLPATLAAALADGSAQASPPGPGWQPVTDGLLDGGHVTTLAWQEDVRSLDPTFETVATAVDGGFRLAGRKVAVPCAAWADSVLVTASLQGQPSLWRAPRQTPGLTSIDACTSDGATVGALQFDAVVLPPGALLARGEAVERALRAAIDEATLLMAWQLVGVASVGLDLTLEYLRTRVQFDHPIGSFQSMQHLAVDVRTQQSLARAACGQALRRWAAAPGSGPARAAIAAAKARASDAAMEAGRFGVQAHGAIGFAAETSIGLVLKAAMRGAASLGNGSQQRRRHAQLAGLHEEVSR